MYKLGSLHYSDGSVNYTKEEAHLTAKQRAIKEGKDIYLWKNDKPCYLHRAFTGEGFEFPTKTVKYQGNLYNIGYSGPIVRLDCIDPDPNGDGTGRGSGSLWMAPPELERLIQQGKVAVKPRPGQPIEIITTTENKYAAYYKGNEDTPGLGDTPEQALRNLNALFY